MKSDKSTFYSILLWGIVTYAIALLTYCTLRAYICDNKDFISSFGSIIGGIGTFFAAFIAAYLFNDWKEQHNKTIIGGDARKAFTLLHNERNYLLDLQHKLKDQIGHSPKIYFTVSDQKMVDLINNLVDVHNQNRFELAEFIFLIEDQDLRNEISNYRNAIKEYLDDISDWKKNIQSYDNIYEEYKKHLKNCYDLNAIILNSLKKYILYKDSDKNRNT